MTTASRDFVAAVEAVAGALTDEQRARALNFLVAMLGESSDRVDALRKQHDFERRWEEELLGSSGPEHAANAARRSREP
jgi:hypothetical protein